MVWGKLRTINGETWDVDDHIIEGNIMRILTSYSHREILFPLENVASLEGGYPDGRERKLRQENLRNERVGGSFGSSSQQQRRSSVRKEMVWRLDCSAAVNSSGPFDSPPDKTTVPYPYVFTVDKARPCRLRVNLSLWVRKPEHENVLEIKIDRRVVEVLRADWSRRYMDYDMGEIDLGQVGIGSHSLEFSCHWENDVQTPDNYFEAHQYFTIASIEIFEN